MTSADDCGKIVSVINEICPFRNRENLIRSQELKKEDFFFSWHIRLDKL